MPGEMQVKLKWLVNIAGTAKTHLFSTIGKPRRAPYRSWHGMTSVLPVGYRPKSPSGPNRDDHFPIHNDLTSGRLPREMPELSAEFRPSASEARRHVV